MRAAWYERQGPAEQVLVVGELEDPLPGPGEVRLRVHASGVNPGDVKKRADAFGYGMPYPRVVPHSDGAGVVDALGEGVAAEWRGRRAWCWGAQSYRPFGTAAELVVVPLERVVPLPDRASFAAGACLGIPGLTAHRCVALAGPLAGRTVLVHGAAGAVGGLAVRLADRAGARVLATVRAEGDERPAREAGAERVVRLQPGWADEVRRLAPGGVDHVIDVDLGSNAPGDAAVLAPGGSIVAYASRDPQPALPFWPLLFQNATLHLVGSDDLPLAARLAAAEALNRLLEEGWDGPPVAASYPLAAIAAAHRAVESGARGRILVQP